MARPPVQDHAPRPHPVRPPLVDARLQVGSHRRFDLTGRPAQSQSRSAASYSRPDRCCCSGPARADTPGRSRLAAVLDLVSASLRLLPLEVSAATRPRSGPCSRLHPTPAPPRSIELGLLPGPPAPLARLARTPARLLGLPRIGRGQPELTACGPSSPESAVDWANLATERCCSALCF
jgi:hypothetical protein